MISRSAFETILKEYDEKQLNAARMQQQKRAWIEEKVPRLKEIENRIAAFSVNKAIARISGDSSIDASEEIRSLKEEKKAVLAAAGFSLADLEAVYECDKCHDTGYVGSEMCSCLKRRITEVLYDQSNIKAILREENFDTFSFRYYPEGQALDVAKQAVSTARSFIDGFSSSDENLFITGGTGVGKTFLTNCIAKDLIDRGFFVVYLSAIRLFDILSDAAFGSRKNGAGAASAELMKKYIFDCDLLVIDDLGTEMVNSFISTQLFECINERLLAKKHTIISTNLSLKQVQDNYSERVFSRIVNKYTLIRLLGDDIRKKKKLEDWDAARRD